MNLRTLTRLHRYRKAVDHTPFRNDVMNSLIPFFSRHFVYDLKLVSYSNQTPHIPLLDHATIPTRTPPQTITVEIEDNAGNKNHQFPLIPPRQSLFTRWFEDSKTTQAKLGRRPYLNQFQRVR